MIAPVRLLLVDDSRDFLTSAVDFLSTRPEVDVAGEATSGAEALELIARIPVDLVLLDLNMRGLNGFETARRLRAQPNAPKIVILTIQDAPEYRHLALAAGANAFIAKSEFTTALPPLIDSLFPQTPVHPLSPET